MAGEPAILRARRLFRLRKIVLEERAAVDGGAESGVALSIGHGRKALPRELSLGSVENVAFTLHSPPGA